MKRRGLIQLRRQWPERYVQRVGRQCLDAGAGHVARLQVVCDVVHELLPLLASRPALVLGDGELRLGEVLLLER